MSKNSPSLTPEQERFEKFYRDNAPVGVSFAFGRDDVGNYLSEYCRLAWKAWQAAITPPK